jgi:Sulfatase
MSLDCDSAQAEAAALMTIWEVSNGYGSDLVSPRIFGAGKAQACGRHPVYAASVSVMALSSLLDPPHAQAQTKPPNIVMLMTDDTGWQDFGAYSGGGVALGHPTPNVDRIAKEGATFTNWYGQASCTAGRASFITGRIPIRSALSIVVAPGDENYLRKETPTIAEFFQKNGYSTYFSGKWHLGDKPDSYPTAHGLAFRRLLCRRLCLRRHLEMVSSLVPVLQPRIQEGVRQHRESR